MIVKNKLIYYHILKLEGDLSLKMVETLGL